MKTTTTVLVAACDGFRLFERPEKASGDWRSFKLVLEDESVEAKKRNWWLGWNGERLARGRDAALLEEHHPAAHAWVIETLAARP